jgi:hypothetical protein
MKAHHLIAIGICAIVNAMPASAGTDQSRVLDGGGHYWMNPDGTEGIAEHVPQKLNGTIEPYWINPDGVRGPVGNTTRMRLGTGDAYWVNPDGERGLLSTPPDGTITQKIATKR